MKNLHSNLQIILNEQNKSHHSVFKTLFTLQIEADQITSWLYQNTSEKKTMTSFHNSQEFAVLELLTDGVWWFWKTITSQIKANAITLKIFHGLMSEPFACANCDVIISRACIAVFDFMRAKTRNNCGSNPYSSAKLGVLRESRVPSQELVVKRCNHELI